MSRTQPVPQPDRFISVDVETDGPIAGKYSLLTLGMCVAGDYDGVTFTRRDPDQDTFYMEFKPEFDEYIVEALRVSAPKHLTAEEWRDYLVNNGASLQEGMAAAEGWINRVCKGYRPVCVAWPIAFDWPFVYRAFELYAPNGSPFGFSGALCVKQLFAFKFKQPMSRATKRNVPKKLRSTRIHTHNALDDAKEQSDLFCSIVEAEAPTPEAINEAIQEQLKTFQGVVRTTAEALHSVSDHGRDGVELDGFYTCDCSKRAFRLVKAGFRVIRESSGSSEATPE